MICDKRRRHYSIFILFFHSQHWHWCERHDTLNSQWFFYRSLKHPLLFLLVYHFNSFPSSFIARSNFYFLSYTFFFCLLTRKYNLCDILFLLNYKSIVWASQTHFALPHRLLLSTTSRISTKKYLFFLKNKMKITFSHNPSLIRKK